MVRVIDWSNFPDIPPGFKEVDVVEVKRVYDYELPPLVVYVGVAVTEEDEEIPVIAVVEEGNNYAKLYLLVDKKVETEELISAFV